MKHILSPSACKSFFKEKPDGRRQTEELLPSATYHLPSAFFHQRTAYVFLISVLFIGAIAMTTAATLVILGIGAQRNSQVYAQSSQALANAETCVERALQSLRISLSYVGNETLPLANGTCQLLAIGGSGNFNRIICAKGIAGNVTRRIEVRVQELLPRGTITVWQEVSAFTLCSE